MSGLGGSCLAERLSRHARLSATEQAALDALEDQDCPCRRGAVVMAENEKPRELFIVRSGWLHSSAVLGNGTRQIMRFHFQGAETKVAQVVEFARQNQHPLQCTLEKA